MQECESAFVAPVTQPGDVWLLGPHRLVCGDATDAATVRKALDGARPHLMWADPPYGVSYDPDWRQKAHEAGLLGGSRTGACALGKVANDHLADWRAAWAHFEGDVAYVWHGALHSATVRASLEACGFLIRSEIVWDKGRLIISRGHYHWRHEPCWYAVRKGRTAHWVGDRKQCTLWQVPHRRSRSGHSTEKPVELALRPIRNHTRSGDGLYDPFAGSGTSIEAAEISGRVAYAIEIDPEHCDRAVRRWETLTGRKAERG